jgi:hypothetical protein
MRPDDILQRTRDDLERERVRIQREINGYPTPIPGCDVYFNDLLEKRSRICEELNRLGSVKSDAAC